MANGPTNDALKLVDSNDNENENDNDDGLSLSSLTLPPLDTLPPLVREYIERSAKRVRLAEERAAAAEERATFAQEKANNLGQLAAPPLHQLGKLFPLGPHKSLSYRGHDQQNIKIAHTQTRSHEYEPIAELEEHSNFGLLPLNWHSLPRESGFRFTAAGWLTESDIQTFVHNVLSCIVVELFGEHTELVVRKELSFAKWRPDILVLIMTVRGAEIVVGVCEVKVPDPEGTGSMAMDDKIVLGQLFTYMNTARSLSGVRKSFGILSTYRHWRICWLPDAFDVAAETKMRDFVAINDAAMATAALPREFEMLPDLNRCSPLVWNEPPVSTEIMNDTAVPRILHSTPAFSWDDPSLIDHLGSVVWKMATTEREAPVFAAKDRNQLFATTFTKTFSVATLPSNFVFQIGPLPSNLGQADLRHRFFLLKDLQGGRDGRVWLGATNSGACCVIKFLKMPRHERPEEFTDEELSAELSSTMVKAQEEAAMWRTLWNLDAVALKLAGKPVVVLPWLKTLDENSREWHDPEVVHLIADAVHIMVTKGICHNDIEKRHVGLYKLGHELRVALLDLSDVRHLHEDEHPAEVEVKTRLKLGLSLS